MAILLLLLSIATVSVSVPVPLTSTKSDTFKPPDNYLLDCGSSSQTTLPDRRTFASDSTSSQYLQYDGRELNVNDQSANVPLPIYKTAKVFNAKATYSFHVTKTGWHWVRLHFYPVQNKEFKLHDTKFTVVACDTVVLLHEYTPKGIEMQEYLMNVTTENLNIRFSGEKDLPAFINAIEVVSAPDMVIADHTDALFPVGKKIDGMTRFSFQKMYRLNVGGAVIGPGNDTLGRYWDNDHKFLKTQSAAKNVSIAPNVVTYLEGRSPLIAPPTVYASAVEMGNSDTIAPNFNITWEFDLDHSYPYLIRLHFCDIVSKSLNELYFNVYVGGKIAISALDLSTVTNGLSVAYYKDVFVEASLVSSPFLVQVGPLNEPTGTKNAILNGLEILRINNSVNSLDGAFGADGKSAIGPSRGTVAAVGFAMMFGAFAGLSAMAVKWQKRPQDWQKKNSFSSWLLPLHSGDSSFMGSSKTSLGSKKSAFYSSTMGLGRYLSFAELQEATKNWDPNSVIGVGGFGNVYLGVLEDGTKVAVKRGNPQSEQGINEFQTELQMLSKLRHRHLVSLIGYCDENAEMILVYEYMEHGPMRDHLYGKNLPLISWKQRLEICIGAARGLHYLHTGAATAIIHRDVKSTNILLDENFIAKMADFGLSKDVGMGEAHVSTAVKGSFGYLDPEYFRKQQLTDKSDVYSFGVVLLEVLCARPAIDPALPREQVNLAEWAMQWKRKGLLNKIIDPNLVGRINPESMDKFAEAAEKCLSEYGVDRPTMGDVLWNLEYALQLQDQGKTDDGGNGSGSALANSAPLAPVADSRPVTTPAQVNQNPPAEVEVIEEHSGTHMFAHPANLNSR
ncbi:putative receptor-like protein kinase At4g39110 [Bidens hawaiensis]|uniref:putative receptor-like protein kinase At4g39110 n=1 Tax=Bidens hawaiensis TaxID=980011 RepID=UPI0040494AD7